MIQRPKFAWHRDINAIDLKVKDWIETDVEARTHWDATLLGIPFSRASISASGASEFPDAFRRSWELFTTYYIDEMIDFRDYSLVDLGHVALHASDVSISHANMEKAMSEVLNKYSGSLHTTIGGDHSITAPLVRAVSKAHPGKKIGIVQFDTHLDMRDFSNGRTNGSPIRQLVEEGYVQGKHVYNIGLHGFYNAPSLLEAATKHKINMIPLKQMRKNGPVNTIATVFEQLRNEVDLIYVTVDIDVLDIAYAPGVPSATPGGMRTDELYDLLFEVGKYPVTAIDFVCIDPLRDIAQQTVKATSYAYFTFIASTYLHQKLGSI